MNIRTSILFLIIFALASCKPGNEIAYTNLFKLYQPEADLQISGMRVYHENDSVSQVYLRYSTQGLLYLEPPGKDYQKANYSFSYQLFSSFESNEILDKGSFVLSDSLFYKFPQTLEFDFPVKAQYPGTYLLEIRFTDLNADEDLLYPKVLTKNSVNNAQNFLTFTEFDELIYEDWVSWKTKFYIQNNQTKNEELLVSYYGDEFPAALPPFSKSHPPSYKYEPDDVFTIGMDAGCSEMMQKAREGIYHFQATNSDHEGFTLFRFHDHYPEVRLPRHLVPPLRYLTSNKEFESLMNAPDPKIAVDSFWVSIAGNEARALELIKKYYRRVEFANRYFASHKEGWKTDRGMLYIIYGEPTTVFRRSDIETWIYGQQGNRVYLTFDFIKAINPFTDNDFELQRQADFKQQWYNAILFWRQ